MTSIRLFLLFALCVSLSAQVQPADSLRLHPHRTALFHALGQPTLIWAANWYLLEQEWADISIKTLQNNIETGWVWDEDGFAVNQVGHPIQGAFVYTAARAQGLEYWQSVAYPTLASLIWEVGMENESPSINDMITTPMSGVAFGEIIHRLSVLTLGSAKEKSVSRQVITGIMNPFGYGLNRIVYGKAIHENFKSSPMKLRSEVSYGLGNPTGEPDQSEALNNVKFIRLNLIYGNPLSGSGIFKPFDNFSFTAMLNANRRDWVGSIYASGMLSKLVVKNRARSNLVLGVFQNYDFMNQDDYKVSSASVGPGLIHAFSMTPKITLGTNLNTSIIFMGGAGDYSDEDEMRDYHSGPGFSVKLQSRFMWADRGEAYLRLKRYFIYAMEDTHIEGYENINLLSAGSQVSIHGKYAVGFEYLLAARTVSYLDVERSETLQTRNVYRLYFSHYLANNLFSKKD